MWKSFKNEIGANDLWLSLFFIILLINLAFSMIVPLPEGHKKASLDVVTRTATAVLAGYFISKNFISKKLR